VLVDFHCHTTVSDGVYTPSEVVRLAAAAKISSLAITDHDAVSGCREAAAAIKREKLPLSLLQGVEFSIEAGEDEVHMLGLAIDDQEPRLVERLHAFSADRENRVYKILAKLEKLGYSLTPEEVFAAAGDGAQAVGRPHVAAALVKRGYFNYVYEVFDKLLYNNGPAYVSHLKPSLKEAIDLTHAAKGLAVIAHPYGISDQSVLEEAARLGIDAIEAYYPQHTPEQVKHYKAFARRHGLKVSGGSDFHGIKNKYPHKLGVYAISAELLNLW
jgi:predicted metal-dependent phosphoesterase TrpH